MFGTSAADCFMHPAGLEPAAFTFGVCSSIRLSYGCVLNINKYFNITNYESEEKINNKNNNIINKKDSPIVIDNERNNEIKVLKNNKAVYVNTYLLNCPSASKNLKKLNKITFIGKSKRSSKFRGVSKNGNQVKRP